MTEEGEISSPDVDEHEISKYFEFVFDFDFVFRLKLSYVSIS
jgi:hypothetical protein